MSIVKPLKVTAEFTITPEDFIEWCENDINPTDAMFKVFVEKMIWYKLGVDRDACDFDDFISKPVEFNGIKITINDV